MTGKMTRRAWVAGAIVGALLLLLTTAGAIQAASGGDFSLFWWTVDSGGGKSTGADEYALTGSIGQQDAEEAVSTGGEFRLAGGFWHNDADAGAALAAVAVRKTVGLTPTSCAATTTIDLTEPATVYFCLTIRNTGGVTLTHHVIVDTPLGINQEWEAPLAPGAALTLTQTQIPALAWQASTSLTNTVAVTSSNFGLVVAAETPAVVGRVQAAVSGQAQVRLRIPTTDPESGEPQYLFLPVIR